jgi:hypothetical protein
MRLAKAAVLVGLVTAQAMQSFGPALASGFSTKWSIKNQTSQEVTLRCKNASSGELKIALSSLVIAADATAEYDWGEAYDNDGMGLNPGTWACSAASGKAKVFALAPFATTWGEAIVLKITGDGQGLALQVNSPSRPTPQRASLRVTGPQSTPVR